MCAFISPHLKRNHMTPEQRLDRAERIILLITRAGARYRNRLLELDEKISIIVDAQIRNEERFARNEERFARFEQVHEERFTRFEQKQEERAARYDDLFVVNEMRFAQLAEFQIRTEQKIEKLIEIVRKGRNGELAG